jgi:hypothetical protein
MEKIIKSASILYFVLIVCMLLFQGCATLSASPGQPVAPFPTMTVGDTVVLTGLFSLHQYGSDPFTLEITEVKPDGSFVYEAKGEKTKAFYLYYNNKYQLEKIINIYTNKEQKTDIPRPPAKTLVFPLFVGKKWRDTYNIYLSAGLIEFSITNSYAVDKYETINTKAGSFKTFRINRRWSITGRNYEGLEKYWYAPEIKCIVKYERNWMEDGELISYKLATMKTTPPSIEITSPSTKSDGTVLVATERAEIRGVAKNYRGEMKKKEGSYWATGHTASSQRRFKIQIKAYNDSAVDYSKLKKFKLLFSATGTLNPLLDKHLNSLVRESLIANGLMEDAKNPDFIVVGSNQNIYVPNRDPGIKIESGAFSGTTSGGQNVSGTYYSGDNIVTALVKLKQAQKYWIHNFGVVFYDPVKKAAIWSGEGTAWVRVDDIRETAPDVIKFMIGLYPESSF